MSSTVPFRDLEKRLVTHGWELVRINGSHHIFSGVNRPMLSIPVHKGKVKRVYAKKIDKAIEQLGECQGEE